MVQWFLYGFISVADLLVYAKASEDTTPLDDGDARYGSPRVRYGGAGPATKLRFPYARTSS